MATSKKVLREALKARYVSGIIEHLELVGEEVLRTGSNEFAIPCLDDENNEEWVVITVKVPTGSRDGEGYDGYEVAQDYQLKLKQKAEKAEAAAQAKAKKIARDKATREARQRKREEANA